MTLAINILLWLVVGILAVIRRHARHAFCWKTARVPASWSSSCCCRASASAWSARASSRKRCRMHGSRLGSVRSSGLLGVLIATLGGALTPGGPVVGFSIGAAALKSGAGAPQVIAYSTAWALYAIHRLVIWEVPMMPARVVWLRALVSLPLPFLAAGLAILLGRP